MTTHTALYELRSQSRCLTAHAPSSEDALTHGFLAATAMLRGPNEIRLLRYTEEEEGDLRCVALWVHNYEITSMSGCPTDGSLLSTVYSPLDDQGCRGTVWRLPEVPEESSSSSSSGADSEYGGSSSEEPMRKDLEQVADLPVARAGAGSSSPLDALHHLAWAPKVEGHKPGTLVSAHSGSVRCWSLEDGGRLAESSCARFESEASFVGGVAWDPHHPAEVAVATDGEVNVWDVRSSERARSIAEAVSVTAGCVRGLSYNPNKPWHLASCGDDNRVKIWDLRRCAAPVKILDGHSSWATCVAFNPFHDQLVLSGGADCRVDLWRVSSVSSAPLLELGEEEGSLPEEEQLAAGGGSSAPSSSGKQPGARMAADIAVRMHVDHVDTVTSVAWSSTRAWVYASLSYTGRVAVSQVSSGERYQVLL